MLAVLQLVGDPALGWVSDTRGRVTAYLLACIGSSISVTHLRARSRTHAGSEGQGGCEGARAAWGWGVNMGRQGGGARMNKHGMSSDTMALITSGSC